MKSSTATTGSGIGDFILGAKVRKVAEVHVGDLLADYSPQFDALNLIRVTRVFDDKFYARHVDPQNPKRARRFSTGEFCVWGFQIGTMNKLNRAKP